MILDGIMVSSKLTRWREIEETFRACTHCKKTHFSSNFFDVTPCAEHKPLVKELLKLAEETKR